MMNIKIRLTNLFKKKFSKDNPEKKARQITPTLPLVQEKGILKDEEILSCDQVFALLDKYVELDLEGLDARQKMPDVYQHLKICEDCNREYQTLVSIFKKPRY